MDKLVQHLSEEYANPPSVRRKTGVSQIGEYFNHLVLTALGSPKVRRVEQVRYAEDATGYIGFILGLSHAVALFLLWALLVAAPPVCLALPAALAHWA